MEQSERVELHPAYTWDCPECGRENWLRGVTPSLAPEDEQDLREEFGLGRELGEFVQVPIAVSCTFCDSEFDCGPHVSEEE